MSAKRVDTAIVVVAVTAAVIGAAGLLGVLGQAWMGYTPSQLLTFLPMILLPIAFALATAAVIRAVLRRRQTRWARAEPNPPDCGSGCGRGHRESVPVTDGLRAL